MDKDPQSNALEQMISSNRQRMAETEKKLGELQGVMNEFRELIAKQQGIDVRDVDAFLETQVPPDLRAQAQAELDEQLRTAGIELPQQQEAAQARRPAGRRPLV